MCDASHLNKLTVQLVPSLPPSLHSPCMPSSLTPSLTPSLTQRDLTNTHRYLLQLLCYSFSACCGARLSGILSLLSFLSLVFLRQLIMCCGVVL